MHSLSIIGIKIVKILALLCTPRQSAERLRLEVGPLCVPRVKLLELRLLHLVGHLLRVLHETHEPVLVVVEILGWRGCS